MSERFQRVASVDDVPDGGMVAVMLADGKEILLVRSGEQVYALDIMCSHQEAWLDSGFFHRDSLEVECPLHEGRFDARSGNPTREPPTDPIATYAVSIDGSDILVGEVQP